MIRALALATVLVLAFVVLITSLHFGIMGGGETRYTSSHGTPSPPQNGADGSRTASPVRGEAPWALSALPECVTQLSRRSGSRAYAGSAIPRGARPVAPPATLRVADCELHIDGSVATVSRGQKVLTVSGARFFVAGDTLVLDRRDGRFGDVRLFALANGTRPAFVRGGSAAGH